MRSIRTFWAALVVVSILFGVYLMISLSLPYAHIAPGIDFLLTKTFVYHLFHWRISFYIHVFTSTLVLVAGLLQFITRYRLLHRFSGYVYSIVVLLLSGPTGLVMAFYANGGTPARVSFVLLSVLWLGTTVVAMWHVYKRQWQAHAHFMLRSYALALSALTLRAYAFLIGYWDIDIRPATAYILIAWLSWTLNLLLAEVLIRQGWIARLKSHS
jgi:hypothetical protein